MMSNTTYFNATPNSIDTSKTSNNTLSSSSNTSLNIANLIGNAANTASSSSSTSNSQQTSTNPHGLIINPSSANQFNQFMNNSLNSLINNSNSNNNSNSMTNTINRNVSGNITPPNSGMSNNISLANNLLLSNPSPNNRQNQLQNQLQNQYLFRSNSQSVNSQQQQQQLSNLLQQQQQQQQKKLPGNLLNLVNPSINATIHRPASSSGSIVGGSSQSNQMTNDSPFATLDPSDFPVLHRTSHSPFQQHQQLQQTLQQFRSSLNQGPTSAPILNTQSTQSLMMHLASANSSSQTNLANLNLNNSNNSLSQQFNAASNLLYQASLGSASNSSSKMWSNFNSSKDNRLGLKTQQSGTDNQHQEFNIQPEDFPALPRPQSVKNNLDGDSKPLNNDNNLSNSSSSLSNTSSINVTNSNNMSRSTGSLGSNQTQTQNQQQSVQQQQQQQQQQQSKKGILISPDGRIKNVPPNMLLDQFGMVGLLAYLRSADKEKDFFALALGTDLTALGLNLNSNENLYQSFLSPFSDVPCRLQDIDFPVPTEYIINCQIKDKLAPIELSRYSEDTLFFLFYMNGGDLMQLQAAAMLYDRDWRYHVEKRIWLTKVPGIEPIQKANTFEKGIYTVFDVMQWRKLQIELTIEYSKLAEKPMLSPQFLLQQQHQQLAANSTHLSQLLQLQQQQQAFTSILNNTNNPAALTPVNTANTPNF